MKTKHLLTGLVLPALFAACTAEEIVEQQAVVKNDLNARPIVGNVTLNTGDVDSRATLGEGWNSLSFTEGDKIGARIMDVYSPYTGTSCDEEENCAVCANPYWNYTINDLYASSNYQYIYDGSSDWNTDALMVEGNYMFYFPYNEKFLGRGPVKFTLPLKQNVAVDGDTQPIKDLFEGENPYLVAYNFLPAEGQDPTLGLDFQHVYAYPKITLKNTYKDTDDTKEVGKAITVDKIIISSAEGLIKDEGTIKHQALANALNNVLIDECDNEYHAAVEAGEWVTLDENARVKKGTFKKYIKAATSDDIIDFNGEASYITVDIENVTLEPGETFSFYAVMPALKFAEDDLSIKVYLADNKMFEKSIAFETLNGYITFVPGKRYPQEEYNYSGVTATPKTTAGALATFDLDGKIVDAVLPIKPIKNIAEFEAMLDEIADNTLTLKEGTNAEVNAGTADFSLAVDKDGKPLLDIDDALMALLDEYLNNGKIEFTSPMVVKASKLDNIKFNNVTFASANLAINEEVEATAVTVESGKVTVSSKANKSLGKVTVNAGELIINKANFLDTTAVVVADTKDEKTGEVIATGTLTINAANSLDNVTMEVDADVAINAAVTVDDNNITAGTITNNSTIALAADWTIAENVTFENKGKIAGAYDLNNAGTITTTKSLDVEENEGLIEVKSVAVTLNVASGDGEVNNTEAGMVSAPKTNTVYAELDEITSVEDDINKAYDAASGVTKIVATGTWSVRVDDTLADQFTEVEFKGASLSMASVELTMRAATVTISANTTWTGRGTASIVNCKKLVYGMYDTNADDTDDTYYTLTIDKVVVKKYEESSNSCKPVDVNEIALEQAAEDGGVVTLTADVKIASYLNIQKDMTLNLNGKTLSMEAAENKPAIYATTGNVVIQNGTIEATMAVWASGADVTIKNGTYKGITASDVDTTPLIYSTEGTITIENGSFEGDIDQKFLLNCKDASYKNKTANIVVKGGSFKNYNPAVAESESPAANWLATGYGVKVYEGTKEVTNVKPSTTPWNGKTYAAQSCQPDWTTDYIYTVVPVNQ